MYADDHGRVRLLDAADRRERAAYRVDFGVTNVAYTPDGCHLHLCGLIVHHFKPDPVPGSPPGYAAPVQMKSEAWLDTAGKCKPCESAYREFFLSADGRTTVRASGNDRYFDGDVTLGPLAPSKAGRPVRLHIGQLTAIALTSDPGRIAFAPDNETIRVRDLRTLNEIHRLTGHKNRVHKLAISADGKRLVSGGGASSAGRPKCSSGTWTQSGSRGDSTPRDSGSIGCSSPPTAAMSRSPVKTA
jgi:hypothetical protein